MTNNNHQAGPLRGMRSDINGQQTGGAGDGDPVGEMVDIPSIGLQFYLYRRALFLAGQTYPDPSSSSSTSPGPAGLVPDSYAVPRFLPAPLPAPADLAQAQGAGTSTDSASAANAANAKRIARISALFDGPDEGLDDETWDEGVEQVWEHLNSGKKIRVPLRLGLAIKILRAGWVQDGTWPCDKETGLPMSAPPDSPILGFDADLPTRGSGGRASGNGNGNADVPYLDLRDLIQQNEALQHNAQLVDDTVGLEATSLGGGVARSSGALGSASDRAAPAGEAEAGSRFVEDGLASTASASRGGRWDMTTRGGLT